METVLADKIQIIVPVKNKYIPIENTFFRPILSDKAPQRRVASICPPKKNDIESCALELSTKKYSAICGILGKKISLVIKVINDEAIITNRDSCLFKIYSIYSLIAPPALQNWIERLDLALLD